jgi:hypothetical protein
MANRAANRSMTSTSRRTASDETVGREGDRRAYEVCGVRPVRVLRAVDAGKSLG